jgi:ribonuclease G
MEYLIKTWQDIEPKAATAKSPSMIHAELDVLLRAVRDLFTPDIDRLVVDNEESFNRIEKFISDFMPSLKNAIELYKGPEPIFDHFGIEVEVTRALGQKVWLKSGGYIIIEQTEALTAIDVNTGRFVGRHNLDDTILKTNLEAVKEIVYQLRLRNIGGIIILDFIDMERHADRQKVFNALKESLKNDRARTTITKISDLGLVEMTRKRTREDLRRQLTDPCTYCEGKGYVKSATTVCYEVFREIQREASQIKGKQIVVYVHSQVANMLYDEERKWLELLEERFKKRISIKTVAEYHMEQFDIAEA